jgi:hypothetical protein
MAALKPGLRFGLTFYGFDSGVRVSVSPMADKRHAACVAVTPPISVGVRQNCYDDASRDVLCIAQTPLSQVATVERSATCYAKSDPTASLPAIRPNTNARSTDTAFGAVP